MLWKNSDLEKFCFFASDAVFLRASDLIFSVTGARIAVRFSVPDSSDNWEEGGVLDMYVTYAQVGEKEDRDRKSVV